MKDIRTFYWVKREYGGALSLISADAVVTAKQIRFASTQGPNYSTVLAHSDIGRHIFNTPEEAKQGAVDRAIASVAAATEKLARLLDELVSFEKFQTEV